jgi:uncharacterized protein YktA (UPF0223 family)
LRWEDIVYAVDLENWLSEELSSALWFFNTGENDVSEATFKIEQEMLLDKFSK